MSDAAILGPEWGLIDLDQVQWQLFDELLMPVRQFPERMRGPLVRYLVAGIRPGQFLQAVISDKLFDAVGRADDENLELLRRYCQFLYAHAPGGSWGSTAAMEEWIAKGGFREPGR